MLCQLHCSNGAWLCLFIASLGVNIYNCLAMGDNLRNECFRVFNCRHTALLTITSKLIEKGKRCCLERPFKRLMLLSGAPDSARGPQTKKFHQKLMILFLWISVGHSQWWDIRADLLVVLFRVRSSLVFEWDFLSAFCCSISSQLRLPQGPASSPAVHLTFRALPGLKPELVCFLLSVCWSQGGSETETFATPH